MQSRHRFSVQMQYQLLLCCLCCCQQTARHATCKQHNLETCLAKNVDVSGQGRDVCIQRLTAAVQQRRDYNKFASSVSEESGKMKAVQKEAVATQLKLDEESLQRLKEAEAKDKVSHCIHGGLHAKGAL